MIKIYLSLLIHYTFFSKHNFLKKYIGFFRLKHAKSENSPYMNNTSFTDIPKNTNIQKTSPVETRQSKSRFRKSAFVTAAVQTKKGTKTNRPVISDNSDSDDSIQSIKKVKKKTKSSKPKLHKAATENKYKT